MDKTLSKLLASWEIQRQKVSGTERYRQGPPSFSHLPLSPSSAGWRWPSFTLAARWLQQFYGVHPYTPFKSRKNDKALWDCFFKIKETFPKSPPNFHLLLISQNFVPCTHSHPWLTRGTGRSQPTLFKNYALPPPLAAGEELVKHGHPRRWLLYMQTASTTPTDHKTLLRKVHDAHKWRSLWSKTSRNVINMPSN